MMHITKTIEIWNICPFRNPPPLLFEPRPASPHGHIHTHRSTNQIGDAGAAALAAGVAPLTALQKLCLEYAARPLWGVGGLGVTRRARNGGEGMVQVG